VRARIKGARKVRVRQGESAEAEALFFSIGEGAIFTDSHARIDRVNRAALEVLGYEEEELLGGWFPGLVKAYDEQGRALSNLDRPIAQVFQTGEVITARAYYARKDGDRVPVFMTVSPVIVDDRPVGAIEVFRDITEEIALERAKDEFVAIASHQLRTPATAVKQYLGLLLEGYADPLSDSQEMFLKRAYESNERQLNIVQEILKVTQLDLERINLKITPVDLANIAREAIDTLKSNFKAKNQKLEFKRPKKSLIAKVDKDQIRVAVENLLENASNYSWEDKTIEVSVSRQKDFFMIKIKDEGVGIDKQDVARLFQKFARIPNPLSVQSNGTGLGLYWADKIVRLHGGFISVKSTPNKGSTFTVNLPASV
jgi:two-component system, OmpR family, phosphate regulon sensor histidine kinase PhoR